MSGTDRRDRVGAVARHVGYWLAVAVVAIALVVGLVAWLNARDGASVTGAVTVAAQAAPAFAVAGSMLRNRAIATSRWDAL